MNISSKSMCVGCGICKGICPKDAITIKENRYGQFQRSVDKNKCIHCNLCAKVCPSIDKSIASFQNDEKSIIGQIKSIQGVVSSDPLFENKGTSGGAITSIIKCLLGKNIYDCAFMVSGYKYSRHEQRKTTKIEREQDFVKKEIFQSRYVSVSHEEAIKYIKDHKQDRIIFVGTSCAVNGILNCITTLGLDRKQYLLLGVFCSGICDNRLEYGLEKIRSSKLLKLQYRSNEIDDWHGAIKLCYDDATIYLKQKSRTSLKKYLLYKRCCFCMDYYNRNSDITFGDLNNPNVKEIMIIRSDLGMQVVSSCYQFIKLNTLDYQVLKKDHPVSAVQRNANLCKIFYSGDSHWGNTKSSAITTSIKNLVKYYIGRFYSINYIAQIMKKYICKEKHEQANRESI